MLQIDKKTYTVLEVAQILGISKSLCYELIKRGKIPSLDIGRRRIIPKKRFDDWLENE